MSKDLVVYALDLTRFERVLGSGDQSLLRKVLACKQREIVAHDEYFREWVPPGQYGGIAEAIARIIDGDISMSVEPAFQYEHAAVMIADVMGRELDSAPLLEASEDFWDEVNATIEGCRARLGVDEKALPTLAEILTRGPLLNVPLAEVRLGCGFLTTQEVRAIQQSIPAAPEACSLDLAALSWPDETLEAFEAYMSWISTASEAKAGLFFHH